MTWTQTIALIAAIVGGAASVIVAVAISTGHIQAQVEAADARALADRAEAAADRRAWQASMDAFRDKADADREAFRAQAEADREAFRGEVRRLSERQARVEGALSTAAVRSP